MADTLKPLPSHGKSLDELLADAKATLGRADQFANEQAGAIRARQAEETAAQSLTPMGTMKRYGAPIKHALDIASIPASIIPSPLQPAAAAYQLAEQGARTAEDPSLTNAGMLALSALPAMQSLRKMTGLKDFFQPEAAAAERAVLRKTFGNRLAQEAPYKLPRDVGNPAQSEPTSVNIPMQSPVQGHTIDTGLGALGRNLRGELRSPQDFERFGTADPWQTPQNFAPPGITRTEGLPEFSPEYNAAMAALDNAVNPGDWRFSPPALPSKANFVKGYEGLSQAQLAEQLGVREGMMPKGTRITAIHKPLYPSGNSKVDKLVAAMRQREYLNGTR